jgi:hypothetical protein
LWERVNPAANAGVRPRFIGHAHFTPHRVIEVTRGGRSNESEAVCQAPSAGTIEDPPPL